MHVYMVFAHNSLKYPHVLGVAYLNDELLAAHLHFPFQHVIAVFGYPHQMHRQSARRVAAVAILAHLADFTSRLEMSSN